MKVFIAKIVWWILKFFGVHQKKRIRAFLWITGNELHELVEVPASPETYREYYMSLYGKIPDFVKHPGNGFYVDLDTIQPNLNIAEIIKREEEKCKRSLKQNTNLILKKYSDISKLDGKILSYLHHTHGCDPITIEDILDVNLSQDLHDEYQAEYAKHRRTGKGQ